MLSHERPRSASTLPMPTPLPLLTSALSRRAALFGAVTVAGLTAASAVPALVASEGDAALIAQAEAFRGLCAREDKAWHDLDDTDDAIAGAPALTACRALSRACRDASEALAEMAATTPAGLAAKAAAMLSLTGPRLDTQAALSEHDELVVSILRDAARLGGGAHA